MPDTCGRSSTALSAPAGPPSCSGSKSPPRSPLAPRRPGFKTCSHCKAEKPSSEFYKNYKGRLRERCVVCCKADSAKGRNPRRASESFKAWKGTNRANTLVGAARYRATAKALPFELEVADIQRRIDANACELTGLPFDVKTPRAWNAPSLDQRRPGEGYTRANTRVILYAANVMMNTWGEGPVLKVAKAISETRRAASNDLSLALGRQLQKNLEGRGSTLYKLAWSERVTPGGLRYFQQRASALPKSDIVCFGDLAGWPAPTKGNGDGGQNEANTSTTGRRPDGSKATVSLNQVARAAGWAAPGARDWKDSPGMSTTGTNPDGTERTRLDQLPRQATLAGWPVPRATDGDKNVRTLEGALSEIERKGAPQDLAQAALICGPARLTASGELLTGSTAGMTSGGQLNPALSRWLMNYPPEWDDCAVTAMPSSRRKPQSSSKPTLT